MTRISPPTGIAILYAPLRVLGLRQSGFVTIVVPDPPEAIGHAILRVEYALDMVLARASAGGVS